MVTFTLLILVRRGFAGPEHTVKVKATAPSGAETRMAAHPIVLSGEPDEGINLRVAIQMPAPDEGLYWIEVQVDDEDSRQIPLRIDLVPAASTPESPPGARAESST